MTFDISSVSQHKGTCMYVPNEIDTKNILSDVLEQKMTLEFNKKINEIIDTHIKNDPCIGIKTMFDLNNIVHNNVCKYVNAFVELNAFRQSYCTTYDNYIKSKSQQNDIYENMYYENNPKSAINERLQTYNFPDFMNKKNYDKIPLNKKQNNFQNKFKKHDLRGEPTYHWNNMFERKNNKGFSNHKNYDKNSYKTQNEKFKSAKFGNKNLTKQCNCYDKLLKKETINNYDFNEQQMPNDHTGIMNYSNYNERPKMSNDHTGVMNYSDFNNVEYNNDKNWLLSEQLYDKQKLQEQLLTKLTQNDENIEEIQELVIDDNKKEQEFLKTSEVTEQQNIEPNTEHQIADKIPVVANNKWFFERIYT